MPPKARIELDTLQRVLYTLEADKLCLLDSSSATSEIWGYLCILMNKADNTQNRRACYDIWKRKRLEFLCIINKSLQKNISKSTIHQSDSSSIPSNNMREIVEINKTTKCDDEKEIFNSNKSTLVSISIHVHEISDINI